MANCSICGLNSTIKYANTPYWMCGGCTLWFQNPLPEKTYEGPHEKDEHGGFKGHLMSDHEKSVNSNLATFLHSQIPIKRNTHGLETKYSLDIGSKYPYLSKCLIDLDFCAWGMDNIEIVPDYSKELNVPMILGDFESIPASKILFSSIGPKKKFDIITMIHVFEHMYNPILAINKLRNLISDDGIIFIRLPDHGVPGFERDLTDNHYQIHPYFHTLDSILELLVQVKDKFKIVKTYPIGNTGQRDIILKPISKKPVIIAGFIVKNEERDLPKALESIESVVDGSYIVDTGSVDNTKNIINDFKIVGYEQYLQASEKIDDDWKLYDFSKARNQFVKAIDPIADWLLWFDADDILLSPRELKRAIYLDQYSVFAIWMNNGNDKFIHHRLWKTKLGIHFEGKCHEYPTILTYPSTELNVIIKHNNEPNGIETSNERNLRILAKEFEENPNNLRTAFYLANTHKDGERYEQAIPFYDTRIKTGIGYRDEWLFAYLYKARCERACGKIGDAKRTLLEACSKDSGWAEFWMELAYICLDEGKNYDAVGFALQAYNKPIIPTSLWRESNKYTDQPARIISHAYNNAGNKEWALLWAKIAKPLIGGPDDDWDQFISNLENNKKKICLCRPGAIGDILMTLNLISLLKEKYDCEVDYYCDESIGKSLKNIFVQAGINYVGKTPAIINNNTYSKIFNLIGYPINEGYPNLPMKKHLIEYFADELGLEINSIPKLTLNLPDKLSILPEHYATIQVKTGWSVYKEWQIEKWEELIARFPDIQFFQIGGIEHPHIKGANHSLIGCSFDDTVSAIANSKLHIGLDSFANHLTNYRWKKDIEIKYLSAIILWGSTQELASGYKHNVNISANLHCQPCFKEDPNVSRISQGVCNNPPMQTYDNPKHECMNQISVDQVAIEIERLWFNKDKHHLKIAY